MEITLRAGTQDQKLQLRSSEQGIPVSDAPIVVEAAPFYPPSSSQQSTSAVTGGEQSTPVVVPSGVWYYAMIDHIEPVFDEDLPVAFYVVADCIRVTYFEAHATRFAQFYPAGVDLQDKSWARVYRTDDKENEAAELRGLRDNPSNKKHREMVADLLSAKDDLLLIRWKLDHKAMVMELPPVQRWFVVRIDNHGGGVEIEMYTHAQAADPGQPRTDLKLAEMLSLPPDGPTARRLSRVISLDFVPEIDFGGDGSTLPPLNPVIVPSPAAPPQLDEELPRIEVTVARIGGGQKTLTVAAKNGGSRVLIVFSTPGQPEVDVIKKASAPVTPKRQMKRSKLKVSPKAQKTMSRVPRFKIFEDDPSDMEASSSTSSQQQPAVVKSSTGSPRRAVLKNISNTVKGK